MMNLLIRPAFTCESIEEFRANNFADADYAMYIELGTRCYTVLGRGKCITISKTLSGIYEGNDDLSTDISDELAEELRLVIIGLARSGSNTSDDNAYTYTFMNYFSDLAIDINVVE